MRRLFTFLKRLFAVVAILFIALICFGIYIEKSDPEGVARRAEERRLKQEEWEANAPARAAAEAERKEREAKAAAEREAAWKATQMDSDAQYIAEKALTNTLRDPGSLETKQIMVFRGQRQNDRAVCGQFNAKNAFGGYVGFKVFIFRVSEMTTDAKGTVHYRLRQIEPTERSVLQNCMAGFKPL